MGWHVMGYVMECGRGRPVLLLLLSLLPLLGLWQSPARAADWAWNPETGDTLSARPVGRVVVRGNATADERLILRTSGLAVGDTVNAYRLRDAVRALWGLGLFSRLRVVDWPDSTGGRSLALEVTENPRIGALSWKGNKKLGDEDLKAKVDLKAGQILSGPKLFQARQAIESAYRDEGYAAARVTTELTATADGKEDLVIAVEEGPRVSIRAIELEGNNAFSAKQLRKQLQLKPNSTFRRKRYTADRLREDSERLQTFYQNHGYKDAGVTAAEPVLGTDGRSLVLRYTIREGPLYRFGTVDWSGNSAVPTSALEAAATVIPGKPYSKARLDETTGAAYELYTEKGYLLELSIQPETRVAGDSVSISYRVEEGTSSKVREIAITGNTRTKERVVRREIALIPGHLLRRSVLMRSHRDIFALGFFEDVQVDYKPAGIGSDVDVSFTVKERSSGTATAGAGYSSDTGLTGFVQFGHNNLFGNGQSIQLQLERGSRRRTYDISFNEPWMLGMPVSLGFQVYNTIRDYDLYSLRERGGGVNLGRPWFFKVPDYSRVYAGYSLEKLNYTNVDTGLDPASREILLGSNGTASKLNLSFARNSTDNPFNATMGSRTNARVEFSGGILGGQINFFKPEIDHRTWFVPFWKPALMIRNKINYLGTWGRERRADGTYGPRRLPGSETFRLGGTRIDYLRGYPDYEVVPEENIHTIDGRRVRFPGGRFAYTFTAEYQFPVVNPVRGLVFLDAGNTWNSTRDFSLVDLKKGVGAGIRVEIPMLGLVGFDYAYGLDRGKWQAHFIIGPAF
jgi:outer membrane protein insertion porin family